LTQRLHDPPVAKDNPSFGIFGNIGLMRDDNELCRRRSASNAHDIQRLGIQRIRFISEQHEWVGDQRAGDGNALLLPPDSLAGCSATVTKPHRLLRLHVPGVRYSQGQRNGGTATLSNALVRAAG
jgi:hypothetical protein